MAQNELSEALRCPVCNAWLGVNHICCSKCDCLGQLVILQTDEEKRLATPVFVNHKLIADQYHLAIRKLKSQLDTSVIACKFSEGLHQKLVQDIDNTCREFAANLNDLEQGILKQRVLDEMLGWGPLSDLLRDPEIVDVFVNWFDEVHVNDRHGMRKTEVRFEDEYQLQFLVERVMNTYSNRTNEPANLILPNGTRFISVRRRPRDITPIVLIFKKRAS